MVLLNALLNKIGISSQPFLTSPKQAMYAIVFCFCMARCRLSNVVIPWRNAKYSTRCFMRQQSWMDFQMGSIQIHHNAFIETNCLICTLDDIDFSIKLIVQTNGHDSRWTTKLNNYNGILYLPTRFHRPSRWLFKFYCLSIYNIDWYDQSCTTASFEGGRLR